MRYFVVFKSTTTWEQRELGEVGTTYTGLSGKTKDDFGHGEGKFITYMNVFSNAISDLNMVEPIEIDNRQNEVKAGDVFFTTSSETPEEVGMSSVLLENSDNTYLNSFCFGYRPTEKFDNKYLAYMLRSSEVRKKIVFLAQGISRYNISKNKMMEIEIPVPCLEEQQQIGLYFCNLDHLITLHQRSYNLEQESKTTNAWEQRELGSVSEKVTKKNQDMVCDEVFTNSAEYGIISQRDFFDKDIANSENIDGYYIVEPNDFVYNPRISNLAPFGPIRRNKLEKSGAMSPLYYVFRTHGVDYGFLEYYFKTNGWHSFMHLNGNSGARSDRFAIRDDVFREMPITMPQNVVEQQAIGKYFTNLDHLITLHQRNSYGLHLPQGVYPSAIAWS